MRVTLDVGSGSGLSSLAARRLDADVYSVDFDPQSVACTKELKRRYFPNDTQWIIEEGSALDTEYISSLKKFDIVYSWGVLHHTGDMWKALSNAAIPVSEGGMLFVSIYNDQESWSDRWRFIKKVYNKLPGNFRAAFAVLVILPQEIKSILSLLLRLQPYKYIEKWTNYKNSRGMNYWYDVIDWVGGYPFEVAKPEEIFEFYKKKGFSLGKMKTCGGIMVPNEFVFKKNKNQFLNVNLIKAVEWKKYVFSSLGSLLIFLERHFKRYIFLVF